MKRNTTIPQSAPLTAPFAQGGLIIGITGGTGSGKTTLLDLIRKKGGLVLDCDAIYHDLLKTDPSLLSAINDRFPGCVKENQLNRKALGAIVFADPAALADLNAITHSAVKAAVCKALDAKPALAAIDAIGLFEGGLAQLCDVTVAVCAPEQDRIARLMARDNISADYAKSRIAAQKPDSWFQAHCDHVLENNGNREQFHDKCLAFLHTLGIMEAES